MSGPERSTIRTHGRLTFALWLALMATTPPLWRVIDRGPWILGTVGLSALLLLVGYAARRWRVPAVGVTAIEAVVWACIVTALFFPAQALFGFIPTGSVISSATELIRTASTEIALGIAPVTATPAVSFVVVAALGVLTVALDHVVLTARMPLLAAVALVMVWLIPAIAVPSGVDIVPFVLLSAAVLFLLRAETRTRRPIPAPRRAGGAVALTVGAASIVGALIVASALPPPSVATVGAGAARIDPSLDLGSDLRRAQELTVLRYRSDATRPPNLRVSTLSIFKGDVWAPDRTRSVPLGDDPLDPVVVAPDVRVVENRTHVEIEELSSPYLPVPYPAVEVTGLNGRWNSVPYSRTILAADADTRGQSYEVVTQAPRPTLEQIRAARARLSTSAVDLLSLPPETPAIVGELAQQVTAGADTDYDKLIALQSWLRGPEFTYSLSTPVHEGFDDAGVAAAGVFLEEKSGYCIHFAGAFALMARSLGLPTRIVVGFLPGEQTTDRVDDENVWISTTAQLHAWPEVYFEAIGWVPFEPTKSLGTATQFSSADVPADESGADVPTDAPTPQPTTTGAAGERPDDLRDDASAPRTTGVDLGPGLRIALLVLALLAVPAAAAALRRAVLRRQHSVSAAWRIVQDAAADVGLSAPRSDSPRATGARLVAGGAPASDVWSLVRAVEVANYAPGRVSVGVDVAQAYADAAAIRRGMLTALGRAERIQAVAMPRSLLFWRVAAGAGA